MIIDISGQKFNRWTVLEFDRLDERGEAYWKCRCDCGSIRSVASYTIRKGTSKGCANCREPHRTGTPYEIKNAVATFTTRKGSTFTVSIIDAQRVANHGWCLAERGYMLASINNKVVTLHQFLLGFRPNMYIDHIDGNRLNNTRANLRWATPMQSAWNQDISSRNTTGYKGVHWNKRARKWQAHIRCNNKWRTIGFYDSREQAALAYNEEAKRLFGDYACINPVGDTRGYRVITEASCR